MLLIFIAILAITLSVFDIAEGMSIVMTMIITYWNSLRTLKVILSTPVER